MDIMTAINVTNSRYPGPLFICLWDPSLHHFLTAQRGFLPQFQILHQTFLEATIPLSFTAKLPMNGATYSLDETIEYRNKEDKQGRGIMTI
jgi:hypothetical protein